jgi:hypothetical protein
VFLETFKERALVEDEPEIRRLLVQVMERLAPPAAASALGLESSVV